MSPVMCHLSGVTCHVSPVVCHLSHDFFFVLNKKNGQSGEASQWMVCYQRGLPRLVFHVKIIDLKKNLYKYLQVAKLTLTDKGDCPF